ncbi:MAG: hypothetical protein JSU66_12135 [Deltaproteobacteria bacterium]|nr:MAG: hypothetical protein JSU66_12135 [Deltaproteobacteria bacterium]
MSAPIPTRIVPSVQPSERTPAQIAREFRRRLEGGARLRPAGEARRNPLRLLSLGYTPKYKIELFDTEYYLTNPRQNPDIRFLVAYVVPDRTRPGRTDIYPRIFYKDLSLVWRSASHYVRSDQENWIGKGELRTLIEGDDEILYAAEETTDLPLEIQTALETLNRKIRRVPSDRAALRWILHRGPDDRIEPYRDFTEPRRRARADRRNLVNGGRSIARFTRKHDPTSLRFTAGFEPDFEAGIVERSRSKSRMYGGALGRFRILSRNRKVQYLFIAGPHQVWVIPPQATTTEITSYGVRSIDVLFDGDLCVPGYEYHFMDESQDPPFRVSQIPEGFAGAPSDVDPSRADASAWLDRLPVIREFRRTVLASRRRG